LISYLKLLFKSVFSLSVYVFYPKLTDRVLLRNLEVPLLYDIISENLWELDEEALTTFQYFTGAWSVSQIATKLNIDKTKLEKIIADLGTEVVINSKGSGQIKKFVINKTLLPSLRTILIHITRACNLECLHCYLDKTRKQYMRPELFISTVSQLDQLQGLKILISGGEPLLHPKLFEMLKAIEQVHLRKVLLSNGTLITADIAKRLQSFVHEVQVSIDGVHSHNVFRKNPTALEKAIRGIQHLKTVGLDVSVATMIHAKNLNELEELESLLKELRVKSWALDIPSKTGEFLQHPELYPSVKEAGAALRKFGWGAPLEDVHDVYACGAHLCAVMPDGNVGKCGFFDDKPIGNLKQKSLVDCWQAIQKSYIWEQSKLDCTSVNCPYLKDCRGGCRFRAYMDTGRLMGVDRVKCETFEFNPGEVER